MDNLFTEKGEIDFDKLNSLEREEYLKQLELVESSKVTLEDFKKFVIRIREAVEQSLVDEPLYIYSLPFPFLKRDNPKVIELRARLKNYLIFERFLFKSDQAKEQLNLYKKKLQNL